MLQLWGTRKPLLLPSPPSPLGPRAVLLYRVLSMGQIKLNCVLMLKGIVWNRNRTVLHLTVCKPKTVTMHIWRCEVLETYKLLSNWLNLALNDRKVFIHRKKQQQHTNQLNSQTNKQRNKYFLFYNSLILFIYLALLHHRSWFRSLTILRPFMTVFSFIMVRNF